MNRATNSGFRWIAALACALAGVAVFQWFGNANQGYIQTRSLFWWWGYQWINPASETEHGWLILGIAAWLFARNLCAENCELRIAECGVSNTHAAVTGPQLVPASSTRSDVAPVSAQSEIRSPQSAFPAAAVAAMLAGLALHAVGFSAQQARISILALLLFAWGVLSLAGGRRWGAAAVFPLAFLVFAIPVNVLDSIGFWLRLWVVQASAAVAHGVGIDVIRNGTQLVAPDGRYSYDVAAACSGVRSLMALTALSLLIGYLNFTSCWRRALTLLVAFPLVLVGNIARIVAIIVAAQAAGPRAGDLVHEVMGYGVFAIVLGGVLGFAALLKRRTRGDCHPIDDKSVGATVVGGRTDVGGVTSPRGITASERSRGEVTPPTGRILASATIVVLMVAAGEMVFLYHISALPERGDVGVLLARDGRNPVELPAFLGRDWVGMPAAVSAVERQILPPDTGFSRIDYVATRDRRHVFLSLVLSGRDRTSIHRPELCLLGQGWTLRGRGTHEFNYPGHPESSFPATLLRVGHQPTSPRSPAIPAQLVAYWFVSGDHVVAGHWERMALDAWNRVVHGRADRWAYVLMETDTTDGENAALARMQAVLNAALPSFQKVFAAQKP